MTPEGDATDPAYPELPSGQPLRSVQRGGVGALVLKAFQREPGVRASAVLGNALDRALDRL